MSDISLPYLQYDEVRRIADEFLAQYHPALEIPIPIERIIEFKMKIDIFPMPGLSTDFDGDSLEVVGYTSLHRKTITVDEWIYNNRINRYRFTLAHEVGHIIMHRALYEMEPFKNIDQWKEFIKNFPLSEYKKFEWQAYAFAGLVLAPRSRLETVIEERMSEVLEAVKSSKIDLRNAAEYIWDQVCELASKDLEVSAEVINKRIGFDKIKENY